MDSEWLARQKQKAAISQTPSTRYLEDRQERLRYQSMRREAERQDEQWRQAWRTHRRELAQLPPEEIAEKVGNKCPYCGSLLIPRIIYQEVIYGQGERPHIIWPDYCGCDQGRMAIERTRRQKIRQQDKIQQDLYQAHLKKAGLLGWLERATLDTFTDRNDWPGAADCREKVSQYIDFILSGERERKNWLILYGNYGTGKSHIAAGIIHEAIDRGYRDVYFRVWPEYLKRINAAWEKDEAGRRIADETEDDIIKELQQGLIVVIDDLDKRQPSEWVQSTLYSVLNYRYNAEMPTILTFNTGPKDKSKKAPGRLALEDYLGKAILDRIFEVAWKVINFDGPSHRLPKKEDNSARPQMKWNEAA